jgi:hypothetical protein
VAFDADQDDGRGAAARDDALQRQLHHARAQGDAYGAALDQMLRLAAGAGDEQRTGDFWIGYAVESASGRHEWADDGFVWREPGGGQVQLLITVRDIGDGRFVPGARVVVTVADSEGQEVGSHEHPLVWHPMLYGYRRDWDLPADGVYAVHVRVEPPTFSRHDERNGTRFTTPAEVEFTNVRISRPAHS